MAHYKGASTEATRATHILKKREKALEELEEKKKKVKSDVDISTIDNKFATTQEESTELKMSSSQVGLITLDQMREKEGKAILERDKQVALKGGDKDKALKIELEQAASSRSKPSKSLSFYNDDDDDDDDDAADDDEDEEPTKKAGAAEEVVSSPNAMSQDSEHCQAEKMAIKAFIEADTEYLPDREREEEESRLREELARKWREQQQKIKEEEIEITFSYWDGSGHRRVVRMKKGKSIYQFLQACLESLRKDFNELRAVSADQLMYVKEDLIIPHHYTFYDFIVTKARGKSGPLFSFDVHEDVRLKADASLEKDESHAGKVLLRSWYERNKHIFPASRWEPYEPSKTYDKYTISDKRAK